jgi:hypothetical protein
MAQRSRFDFMLSSNVKDIDDEAFPDVLSVDYLNTQFTELPKFTEVTQPDIERFWLFMYNYYGNCDYDDLLLMINNVPYVTCLQPGDPIYLPKLSDIESFNEQKQAGSET